MKEDIDKAVKYASDSNKLEGNNLKENEFNKVIESINKKETKEAFLSSVVNEINDDCLGDIKNVKIRK